MGEHVQEHAGRDEREKVHRRPWLERSSRRVGDGRKSDQEGGNGGSKLRPRDLQTRYSTSRPALIASACRLALRP
jgi:hypothetical protein